MSLPSNKTVKTIALNYMLSACSFSLCTSRGCKVIFTNEFSVQIRFLVCTTEENTVECLSHSMLEHGPLCLCICTDESVAGQWPAQSAHFSGFHGPLLWIVLA